MSRPPKEIDWNLVDTFIEADCTGKEIAGHFNMTDETFYNRFQDKYHEYFSAYSAKKNPAGQALLKLAQFKKAVNGNPQMLVWLGKNRLGQRDHELEKDKIPIFDEQIDAENAQMEEKALLRKQLAELQAKIDHLTQTRPELPGIDPSL